MALEVSADYVDTNQPVQDFLVAQRTWEALVDLRFALSSLASRLGGWGDARVGVAGKRQETRTLFSGVDVAGSAVEDYQVQLGWSRAEVDRLGRSDLNVLVHLSPGGVDRANGEDSVRAASQGRLHDARYAYVSGDLDRMTRLPHGWAWRLQAIGQYAAEPLPSTEQAGLGQQSLVRGYTLDDGAYDRAFVLRNELRAPAVSRARPARRARPLRLRGCRARDPTAWPFSQTASSAGLGASAALAPRLPPLPRPGHRPALQSAPSTHAGDWRLESRLSVAF